MPFLNYKNISLQINATIVHDKKRYSVPTYQGEGLAHLFTKVIVAVHLLSWGYPWEKIKWEENPPGMLIKFRPDIYTQFHGDLPEFWFECIGTEKEKLHQVVTSLPHFRVVRVVEIGWFRKWWNGEFLDTVNIKNTRELKQLIIKHRQENTYPGVEYWAVGGLSISSNRILYAVRRDLNGKFVYLDSGEGWSLSGIRYISKRRDEFQPMIPGLVGSVQWRGENSGLLELKLQKERKNFSR